MFQAGHIEPEDQLVEMDLLFRGMSVHAAA